MTGNPEVISSPVGLVPTNALMDSERTQFPIRRLFGCNSETRLWEVKDEVQGEWSGTRELILFDYWRSISFLGALYLLNPRTWVYNRLPWTTNRLPACSVKPHNSWKLTARLSAGTAVMKRLPN